jgi:hypothetical protein
MRAICCPSIVLLCLLGAASAWAHVGSPDVYVRGDAGPYTLYVSVHPPAMLPGAAEIDVRAVNGSAITAVDVLSKDGGVISLTRFAQEQKFVGSAWVPANARLWKLQLRVAGDRGPGEMMVPVTLPAVANPRGRWIGPLVFACAGIILFVFGFILWRERGLHSAIALLVCGVASIAACGASVFHSVIRTSLAPAMQVEMRDDGVLEIKLARVPGGHTLDDIALDHGHRLHLFLIRQPDMDIVLHLHPALMTSSNDAADFTQVMPSMAPGEFALYADIAHSDGVAETATAQAGLPMETGHALVGDDSVGIVSHSVGAGCGSTASLPDGYSMTLDCTAPLHAKTGLLLRVTLLDTAGHVPADMANYMVMGGHAAIVAGDGSVFAHIHPMGTVMVADAMAGMEMPVSNVAEFPYGFPRVGAYRVFVQMRHGIVVETAAFSVAVQ